MAKGVPPFWFMQLLDNQGDVLAGGKVYTYAAGTTTPLDTYSNAAGTANTNPVILDAYGRASIYLTEDTGYKFVVKDSSDVTILTVDNIIAQGDAAATTLDYEVCFSYVGTPPVSGFIGGFVAVRSLTIPANFAGSAGKVVTNPSASYAMTVRKNGSTVGTITISTAGAFTFSTSGGSAISLVSGDRLDMIGPNPVGTAANIMVTIKGSVV